MATIDVMISADEISNRLDALAEEVAAALPPEARTSPVLMIGPLKGAVMVMADLARAHRPQPRGPARVASIWPCRASPFAPPRQN